jgi:hypothetical protein
MTEYRQLVGANLSVTEQPYWGLRMTTNIFQVPPKYPYCWDAWTAADYKHVQDPLPNCFVPVWFHVSDFRYSAKKVVGQSVVWDPSSTRFLSNPTHGGMGEGQKWFDSIEEIEKTFNGVYVGWSEDLCGVRLIEPITGD